MNWRVELIEVAVRPSARATGNDGAGTSLYFTRELRQTMVFDDELRYYGIGDYV